MPLHVLATLTTKHESFMNLIKERDSFFELYTVEDSYCRVEFQMRGSPHEHIFLWLKDAPSYEIENEENAEKCVEFIDRFITCEYDENNPLVFLQRHKHSHTCRKGKKNKEKCRFNFPIPVMPRTMILMPLTEEMKTIDLKVSLKEIRKMMIFLYKQKESISFHEILGRLKMTEDNYILAIRSSLRRTQLFLKRTSLEVGINCYNKSMLNLFEANMDLQFVLEEYGLASYIINYISIVDAGLSKLLRDAASDIKSGNKTIKDKFRNIANIFLNSNLMSAQEAAYHVLSLPLSKMSRQCIFINASPIGERVWILKSNKNLRKLKEDSKEIFMKDVFKKYSERSKEMEDICLADFCSIYSKKKSVESVPTSGDSDDIKAPDKFSERKRPAIIRYRRYKLMQDPVNYYREHILLFLPWRKELDEVENIDSEKKYYLNIEQIEDNRKKYSVVDDESVEMAMENIQHESGDADEDETNACENDDKISVQQIDILEQGGLEKPVKSQNHHDTNVPNEFQKKSYAQKCKN